MSRRNFACNSSPARWRRGRRRCRSRGRQQEGATARQGHQVARRAQHGTKGRRRRRVGASRHPGTGAPCRARVRPTSRHPADWTLPWTTTWASRLGHCADMNGAPLTRTPPRRSWGRGPPPPGWRRIQACRSTCLLLRAVQRRRVESLVLGALSSSPVHRALVLVSGTNIAVLLCC